MAKDKSGSKSNQPDPNETRVKGFKAVANTADPEKAARIARQAEGNAKDLEEQQ